ncbi:MAG: Nif3-like dinuclear metal center hexameric protein [Oscillospiraceae bacterium]|nr:Nif3-like dinuclear metal center hexameric protein [Oscillospiraceae bacterium]
MPRVNEVMKYLDSIAPVEMKMDFDNVGFLVGRKDGDATRILVSLDITSDVVAEAVDKRAGLIVSHHPVFFSLNKVTDEGTTGAIIVDMLSAGIAAICMHTNLDAALGGVNDALAVAAGIARGGEAAEPLTAGGTTSSGEAFSYGRVGSLMSPLLMSDYMAVLKGALRADGLRYHDAGRDVFRVAVVGGSGGSELECAIAAGCDTFVTADIKYDLFLEARERGINLIDAGHFNTENLVIAPLAERLQAEFADANVRVSERHTNPVKYFL